MPEIFMARLRPEFARGERERCCHLFPVPLPDSAPRMLHAYCGATITPGQAELLDRPKGMPCVTCILLSPAGDPTPIDGVDLLGIA
ncbi:hypothetical protein [Kutzneria chonburiensis]|uniref:Uncharacterized protein n=1 Tax=Kutzneria chonburiensis TaxID=1483604 RepID=A0ABV6N815_9PSEU|nr:hypothetical protein [Kutzneria chonburiensis]